MLGNRTQRGSVVLSSCWYLADAVRPFSASVHCVEKDTQTAVSNHRAIAPGASYRACVRTGAAGACTHRILTL